MKSNFRFLTAALTSVSFSFFACLPAVAKETAFNKILASKVARYQSAIKDKGMDAFLASFPELSSQDKRDISHMVKGVGNLPEIAIVEANKIKVSDPQHSLTVEFVNDYANGEVKINGKYFKYDATKGFAENHKALEKLFEGQSFSLWNYIVPQAMALGWLFFLLAGLTVVLGVSIYKKGWSGTVDSIKKAFTGDKHPPVPPGLPDPAK